MTINNVCHGMDNTVFYLTLLLGLIGLAVVIVFGVIHIRKQLNLMRQRDKWRRSVSRYRLSKMLSYIGIHIDDYVMRIPLNDIKKHIANCKSCPDTETCDRLLGNGEYVSDMHFCPNYDSLMTYSRVMPPVVE